MTLGASGRCLLRPGARLRCDLAAVPVARRAAAMAHVPGHPARAARRRVCVRHGPRRTTRSRPCACRSGWGSSPTTCARSSCDPHTFARAERIIASQLAYDQLLAGGVPAGRASRSSPPPRATRPSGSARRSSSPPAAGPGDAAGPPACSGVSPRAPSACSDPAAVGRISMRSAIDCLSASTCDTTPTTRPPARSRPSSASTASSVCGSSDPKPSSTNSVPRSIPPASAVTTSAMPSARHSDT